ncbi:MAG TPA: glycosyltransferase [Microthrixaceae bacterium]|nr:glycosyltransferase [Microthrixaceae bacterium]
MSGAVVGSSGLDIGVYGARGVPSTYSGYETFLTTLLPELVRRGDRVTMYCRPGDGMDNSEWEGVRRRVLPALPGKNFNTLTHGLVAGVAARLARHDVVLVVNVANAAYCAIGRYTRQPTLLNTDGQEWLRDKWGGTAKQVFHRSARIAGRCATALVADCEAMAAIW